MKKIVVLFSILFFTHLGFSQEPMLVQSNSKGLYLTHTVQPKENFYAVGRMYNIAPKDIAAYNSLDMNVGLNVGQTILIPLTAANFSQTKTTGKPVYYTVGEKEGLYRVSVKNGNVLMASLRKWNQLKTDNISTGQRLIVGYLQAEGSSSAAVAKTETAPPATEPKREEARAPQKTETQPQPTKREEPIKEVKAAPPTQRQPVAAGGAGYFKNQFELQSKAHKTGYDATVTSGIFKTTSGWQDAKYYALMDKVEPGTVVQVVNPVNNKSVYAKVLGEMSGIRQNQGLELRISNAAATALDISEPDKFIVRVLY